MPANRESTIIQIEG